MRSEGEKVLQTPIVVILGGTEYEIKPLVIKESREWRKKLSKLLSSLPKYYTISADNKEAFESAMTGIVSGMSDEMIDLFFDYAKDLDREVIESVASETELAGAMEKVLEVALPLVRSLTKSMTKLGQ